MTTRLMLPDSYRTREPDQLILPTSLAEWSVSGTAVSMSYVSSSIERPAHIKWNIASGVESSIFKKNMDDFDRSARRIGFLYEMVGTGVSGGMHVRAGVDDMSAGSGYVQILGDDSGWYTQERVNYAEARFPWGTYDNGGNFWTGANGANLNSTFNSVQLYVTPTGSCSILLYAIVIGGQHRCQIMLDSDDQRNSVHDFVLAEHTARGWKGSCGISTDFIGDESKDRMTAEEIDVLYAAGWDIINHSRSHPHLSTITTESGLEFQILGAKQDLIDNGWVRTANIMSYPHNDTNDRVKAFLEKHDIVTSRGIENVRSTAWGPAVGNIEPLDPFRYETDSVSVAFRTLQRVKDELESRIRFGISTSVYVHAVQGTNPGGTGGPPPEDGLVWYEDDYVALLDFIKGYEEAGVVDVVTKKEWYEGRTDKVRARSAERARR